MEERKMKVMKNSINQPLCICENGGFENIRTPQNEDDPRRPVSDCHENIHTPQNEDDPERSVSSSSLITLDRLREGQSARIEQVGGAYSMRRRLIDLGFCLGSVVKCVMKSPLGDPAAYLVRGTLVALRREDSSTVAVTVLANRGDGKNEE